MTLLKDVANNKNPAYVGRGHIVFDDIAIDEGTCVTGQQYCPKPLRPKKKTLYKEVFTGNWRCWNPLNMKNYNMSDPGVLLPHGTQCKVRGFSISYTE